MQVVRERLGEFRSYLENAVNATESADGVRLATQLHTLLTGAITLGVAYRSTAPLVAASEAASQLLSGARRPARRATSPSGRSTDPRGPG